MNILKKILGTSQKDDLITIPKGQLNLSRSPSSPKSESECLYNDAVACIRETAIPYNYQLVIQKPRDEGDEQLKGDEENDDLLFEELESGDERTFLIADDLNLYKYMNIEGYTTIVWKDFSGDDGDKFVFVCDSSVSENIIDKFVETLWKCAYERKYKKSSLSATDKELEEFKYEPFINEGDLFVPDELFSGDESATTEGYEDDDEEEDDDEDHDEFKDAETSFVKKVNEQINEQKLAGPPINLKKIPLGDNIVTKSCALHIYDSKNEVFNLKASKATVQILESKDFVFWLVVKGDNCQPILIEKIGQELTPFYNYQHLSFIFNIIDDEIPVSYLLKFKEFEDLSELQTNFNHSIWETQNQTRWGATDKADRNYFVNALNDLVLEDSVENEKVKGNGKDVSLDENEDDENDDYKSKKSTIRRSDLRNEDGDIWKNFKSEKGKNKGLAYSYQSNRSYITRGDKLWVFKENEENHLEPSTWIDNIKDAKGKSFIPKNIMLHDQDTSIIVIDPSKTNNIYKLDLNKGKIVEEYTIGTADENIDILETNPTSKFSQMTHEKTFLGFSKNEFFKIDPRLSSNQLVELERKKYISKTNFTDMATNINGNMAILCEDGEVKLYDRIGIKAKTRIPGIEKSTCIDVSADGRWVLVTLNSFLLLIDCEIKEGKNQGSLGFLKSFSKDSKPLPLMLRLTYNDEFLIKKRTKKPLHFTKATFNTGVDSKETDIITSVGPFAITWKLKNVLKGENSTYLIKEFDANIVTDIYKFGSNKEAIVVSENDADVFEKKKFTKLSRHSFVKF